MTTKASRQSRCVGAAIVLFFAAPLVAEFLLGNLPITLLPALLMLGPLYGGGALFIRELVRRSGRGWPSIVILGLAFGIIEEAFTTQSLFNPNYLKLNLHLLDHAFIPALGIGAWWTIFVLNLHVSWSVSTSIALIEAIVPHRAQSPWLGKLGLSVTAVLFAFGVVGMTLMTLKQDSFAASRAQFVSSMALVLALAIVAFLLPARKQSAGSDRAPHPVIVAVLALVAGSAVLVAPNGWGWDAALLILALDVAMLALVLLWARRTAWTPLHKLALAAGAAMAYGWHSFVEKPVLNANPTIVRAGNVLFTTTAIAVIALGYRRTRAAQEARTIVPVS